MKHYRRSSENTGNDVIDTRFPTALQMLLTLANAERTGYAMMTSAQLAYGLGSTASLVRRLLVPLGRDGIVRSSLGKNGGIALARPADTIALSEIYRSVVGEKHLMVARPDVPHLCDVSSHIEVYFDSLASEAEDAVGGMLGNRTLAQSLDELLALKKTVKPRKRA
ncbi:MAG: Rrf2 family transcriptional regulator [Vulcanimicrobiaceae bacterium]